MTTQTDNIPESLRSRHQWVLWKRVVLDGQETKIPFGVDGTPAKTNDPATWSTFENVSAKLNNGGGYAGLGFVFTAEDNLVGIDLDGCRNPETGELAPWADEQIAALDSYAEISPSQSGVKVFVLGKSPLSGGRKRQLNEPRVCDRAPAIELYDRLRYFCVTGQKLDGPAEPQERQVQLDILAKIRFSDDERDGTALTKPPMRLTVQGEPSAKERARAYLARIDPAISHQGGHNTTFRAACKVCIDFNLSAEDALELLREWNARCIPPWNERELVHKVNQALKQPGERGRLLGIGSGSQRQRILACPAEPIVFERLTSAEFDAGYFEQTYIVDDVLVRGEPLVIAAQLKSMKTTLSVALGTSIASGEPFLGRFEVLTPTNVLIMSGESGRSTLQSAGRRIAASHGFELAEVSRLFWAFTLPRLGSIEHLAALEQLLVADAIEVLVCDPLYFMLPGQDAGNLMIVGGYLRTISELCESLGVTLVVVHHNRRTGIENRHEPPELSHISWSGTSEWARQWLLLGRRKDYEPGTGEHLLWMVTGGSAGHSGLHGLDIHEGVGAYRGWSVDVLGADEVRERESGAKDSAKEKARMEKQERDRKKLVQAAAHFKAGETLNRLRERAGLSGDAVRVALATCLEMNELEPCEVTKNGRTESGYKLRSDCSD